MQQNITTSPSGQLYVAQVGIDMPFSYVMFAINNTCSLLKNKYSQAINKCAQGIWQNQCCVDTTAWEVCLLLLPGDVAVVFILSVVCTSTTNMTVSFRHRCKCWEMQNDTSIHMHAASRVLLQQVCMASKHHKQLRVTDALVLYCLLELRFHSTMSASIDFCSS